MLAQKDRNIEENSQRKRENLIREKIQWKILRSGVQKPLQAFLCAHSSISL